LVVLLLVFALAEVTEGGVDTWGVLFLRNHLATGVLLGAGAYVVGQAVAATTRGAGGSLLGRLSSRGALVLGGCVAGGGILLESVAPAAGAAAVGLALGAGGASLFWPLIMSSVSRSATRVVSAVGTFTAAGYVGWVAGAPIVGWVSEAWGPARGLQVLAVAAFGVALITLVSGRRGSMGQVDEGRRRPQGYGGSG
jgi:MFS family permease